MNWNKALPFINGLIGNIANHRSIVYGIYRKGRRIAVCQPARIGSRKGNGFAAVPIIVRRGNGGNIVFVNLHDQIGIAAVRPGHLGIIIVDVAYVIVKINGRKTLPFIDGLIGNVADHRRIINIVHRKNSAVAVGQPAGIGSGKGNGFCAKPVGVRNGNSCHMIGIDVHL